MKRTGPQKPQSQRRFTGKLQRNEINTPIKRERIKRAKMHAGLGVRKTGARSTDENVKQRTFDGETNAS